MAKVTLTWMQITTIIIATTLIKIITIILTAAKMKVKDMDGWIFFTRN